MKFDPLGGGNAGLAAVNRFITAIPEDFFGLLGAGEPDPATGQPELAMVRARVGARPSAQAGDQVLGAGEGGDWPAEQLTGELAGRLPRGPVEFRLQVQLAEAGDATPV